MFQSPQLTDSVDMRGRGRFQATPSCSKADTTASAFSSPSDATMLVHRNEDQLLHVFGLGLDRRGRGRRWRGDVAEELGPRGPLLGDGVERHQEPQTRSVQSIRDDFPVRRASL